MRLSAYYNIVCFQARTLGFLCSFLSRQSSLTLLPNSYNSHIKAEIPRARFCSLPTLVLLVSIYQQVDDQSLLSQADLCPILDHLVQSFRPLLCSFSCSRINSSVCSSSIFSLISASISAPVISLAVTSCTTSASPPEEQAPSTMIVTKPTSRNVKSVFALVLFTNDFDSTKLHTSLQPIPSTNPLHILHIYTFFTYKTQQNQV